MYEKLKKIYRAIIKRLPTKIVLNVENLRGYKRLLKKNRIKYFGEKIQWMKMYGGLEKYSNLVDKYAVREYVKNRVGENYLTNIIEVYDSTSEIDFNKLPEKFVLKLNTGSGYNIICKDKEKLNEQKTIKQLNKWLKEDYTKIKKEPQYKNIDKKIICEEYMENKEGNLFDYKLFCFNGKVEFIEVDFDRFENHAMNFYDTKWNLLDLKKGKYPNYSKELKKPDNLEEMIEIAEKLSGELPFARIDLYDVDGKIYFGEITLTPAGGLTPFIPLSKDLEIAKMIDLNKYRKQNILLFASISKNNGRVDGETIKNRTFKEYLENYKEFNIVTVDTHNFRKNFINIIINTLKNYKCSDKIIISASQTGASKLIRFLKFIQNKKDIYYFLIGGSLAKHIELGKQKVEYFKNINKIYVESQILKQNLSKLGLNNVEVMHNFRKIKQFTNKYERTDAVKFVFFGRVIKVKGIEQSIELIKRLTKNNYKVSLDIYGQAEEEYLRKLKNIMQGYKNIEYCGVIKPDGKNEYEILSNYDVFILPTEHEGEGLPGALIDSYFAGLAVLVSNWRYAKEYVKDEENGYIFEYKNYEDMYDKAVKMIDENKISQFKEKSLELSEQYNIDKVLVKFVEQLKN